AVGGGEADPAGTSGNASTERDEPRAPLRRASAARPMKAVVRDEYGVEHIEVHDVEKPAPADNEVLVRVRAASINPVDWYTAAGPIFARVGNGLRRPKSNRLGTDFAGTVEAVGNDVTRFRVGDDVFGARTGALAEYVAVPEDRAIASKPANTTFEEAGGIG